MFAAARILYGFRMVAPDPSVVLRDLGRRIAELRAARDMTQQGFADQAGFSVQYAQRLESGRENLTVHSLVRIASLLGVTVADLFAAPASRTSKPGRPRKAAAVDDRVVAIGGASMPSAARRKPSGKSDIRRKG